MTIESDKKYSKLATFNKTELGIVQRIDAIVTNWGVFQIFVTKNNIEQHADEVLVEHIRFVHIFEFSNLIRFNTNCVLQVISVVVSLKPILK